MGALSEGVDDLETLPGASGCERRGEARGWGAGGTGELGVAVVACHAVGCLVPYGSGERVPNLNVTGKEPVRRKLMMTEERRGSLRRAGVGEH